MRIYFFFFYPRIANLLSLFYTGKGFFLFFRFSAVGHGFYSLLKRRGEDGRGWKRRIEEAGGDKGRLRTIGRCALLLYLLFSHKLYKSITCWALPQLVTERHHARQPE